jgi:ribosomal protein S21
LGNHETRDRKRNQRFQERKESSFYKKGGGKKDRTKKQEDRRLMEELAKDIDKAFNETD